MKMDNAIRQALKKRAHAGLPSNFSYHMMHKIRLEAEKQRKRRRIISWCWLIGASLSLIGFTLYILFGYLGIQLENVLPNSEGVKLSADIFGFYWYIMLLVLLLLALDFGMRYYRRKQMEND